MNNWIKIIKKNVENWRTFMNVYKYIICNKKITICINLIVFSPISRRFSCFFGTKSMYCYVKTLSLPRDFSEYIKKYHFLCGFLLILHREATRICTLCTCIGFLLSYKTLRTAHCGDVHNTIGILWRKER